MEGGGGGVVSTCMQRLLEGDRELLVRRRHAMPVALARCEEACEDLVLDERRARDHVDRLLQRLGRRSGGGDAEAAAEPAT